MEPRAGFRITGQLVLGASIAVLGILFTLDNLHLLRAREFLQFWPLVLIAIGLVHVSQAKSAAGTLGGAIWVVAGVVLLGNRLGFFSIHLWNLWPLILVLVGARIVWQTLDTNRAVDAGDTSATVSSIAVMGGFERRVTSREFRGGEITAFMGGIEDKSRTSTSPDAPTLVLRGFVMMGGVTLRNP